MSVHTLTLKGLVYSKKDLRYARSTPSQHCTHRLTYTRRTLRHVVYHKPQIFIFRFYQTFTLMAFSILLYRHTSELLRFISSRTYSLFHIAIQWRIISVNWIEFEETWFVILFLPIKSYYKFLNLYLFYMILEPRKLDKRYYYNKEENKYWK